MTEPPVSNGVPAMAGAWRNPELITAVIPAAGRVPEGLLPMSGRLNVAMVPVAGKPVIYWTLSYLWKLGIRRYVIANREAGEFMRDFVQASFRDIGDISWVVPDRDGGLGYTLRCAVASVETSRTLVVLGDTYFAFGDETPRDSFILAAPVEESHRWCMVRADSGTAVDFLDKPADCPPGMQAVVGVYGFSDTEALRASVAAADDAASTDGRRTEMSDVLRYYMKAQPVQVLPPGEWLDCGNPDTLARSHQRLLQKRAFNDVNIDDDLGIFTKRSTQLTKFTDEINFYKLLPPRLRVLFPRVVDSSIEPNREFLSLEYYGYPTLAELWLYENLHVRAWSNMFGHLQRLLVNELAVFRRDIPMRDYRTMYVDKVRERAAQINPGSPLGELIRASTGLVVNGRQCPTFDEALDLVEAALPEFTSDGQQAIIHGDMCFSNILYDPRARVCKLIDPRGSFGQAGIFGDQKYDIAKLHHSVHGMYDFIVNDLFTLKCSGKDIQLDIHMRPEHLDVQRVFDEAFYPHFNRSHVELITATLFLSMPALHYDVPARQLAMYVTGLHLLGGLS